MIFHDFSMKNYDFSSKNDDFSLFYHHFRGTRKTNRDVLGAEDRVEVDPRRLAVEPLLEHVLHVDELRLPVLHLLLDGLGVPRPVTLFCPGAAP